VITNYTVMNGCGNSFLGFLLSKLVKITAHSLFSLGARTGSG